MPHRYTHIDSARLELLEAVLDHRGALLMEAMVAACAIVAHADGRVQPGEPQRMLAAMRTDPLLSAFPRAALLHEFNEHAARFTDDGALARAEALRRIAPLTRQPRLARIVRAACHDVIHADGHADPAEMAALALIVRTLGLPPAP